MYQLTKRDPKDNRIYTVIVDNAQEMSDHVSACVKLTDQEIIAIVKVS